MFVAAGLVVRGGHGPFVEADVVMGGEGADAGGGIVG